MFIHHQNSENLIFSRCFNSSCFVISAIWCCGLTWWLWLVHFHPSEWNISAPIGWNRFSEKVSWNPDVIIWEKGETVSIWAEGRTGETSITTTTARRWIQETDNEGAAEEWWNQEETDAIQNELLRGGMKQKQEDCWDWTTVKEINILINSKVTQRTWVYHRG